MAAEADKSPGLPRNPPWAVLGRLRNERKTGPAFNRTGNKGGQRGIYNVTAGKPTTLMW